jgi:small subunit ribosomal protein S18
MPRNNGNHDKDSKSSNRSNRRPKKKVCQFCVDKSDSVDYKDLAKLRKYITEKGKIVARRISGLCAKHQRQLTQAIKRARHLALIPYTTD